MNNPASLSGESISESHGHVLIPGELDLSHGVALYLEDINVSFDGFKAINHLSLSIDAGELRCIIGPNGAGKTTMMDVITGKTRPDSGTAFFGQTMDLTRMREPEIAHAGIGRKFQKPTVFEQHSVFDNLELALKTNKGIWSSLFSTLSGEQASRIDELLELIRLQDLRDPRAGNGSPRRPAGRFVSRVRSARREPGYRRGSGPPAPGDRVVPRPPPCRWRCRPSADWPRR